ncbi:hypothetical protein [Streptomyces sp. bgisy126]|uniref:hypothetical protein n=1 Tax=unclassified Streptomyces TaxID=2593676 RepID=UPI003EBEB3F6
MLYGERSGWRRDGFESHEGVVGVLLADGSEPKPVVFDLGSGSSFHESSDWRLYDGTFRRPTAVSMRGRWACGWHGTKTYVIDWEKVHEGDDLDVYDTSGPYEEWEAHLDEVAGRAVALPEDLAGLLGQMRERLDRLWLEEGKARVRDDAEGLRRTGGDRRRDRPGGRPRPPPCHAMPVGMGAKLG